jgi:hypothetical protein
MAPWKRFLFRLLWGLSTLLAATLGPSDWAAPTYGLYTGAANATSYQLLRRRQGLLVSARISSLVNVGYSLNSGFRCFSGRSLPTSVQPLAFASARKLAIRSASA